MKSGTNGKEEQKKRKGAKESEGERKRAKRDRTSME